MTSAASLLALFISACSPAFPSEEAPTLPTPAATLAQACSGCHATGNTAMIDLSTYTTDTLNARLLQYQSEDGPTVMHRIARGYSDDQIAEIAAYLTQPTE